MNPIEMPEPPPLPPGPVPRAWEPWSDDAPALERHHRLAVLHEACDLCADPPDGPTRKEWLAQLADPQLAEPELDPGTYWTTPEGELACFVHGQFQVDDRRAFVVWARANFRVVGDAFAYVVAAAGAPWTRALFWFDDKYLRLEASSSDRYFHLEQVFEHLWPPVFRMGRILSGLDDDLDAPFRPHWPRPPAEASAFMRLRPPSRPRPDSM